MSPDPVKARRTLWMPPVPPALKGSAARRVATPPEGRPGMGRRAGPIWPRPPPQVRPGARPPSWRLQQTLVLPAPPGPWMCSTENGGSTASSNAARNSSISADLATKRLRRYSLSTSTPLSRFRVLRHDPGSARERRCGRRRHTIGQFGCMTGRPSRLGQRRGVPGAGGRAPRGGRG
jgi:hypothetical protein